MDCYGFFKRIINVPLKKIEKLEKTLKKKYIKYKLNVKRLKIGK